MSMRAVAGGVTTGVVAGDVGTTAMEPVSVYLYRHEPEQARATEDAARPGPPYRVAAEKITSALGLTLTDAVLDKVALGFHYGLSAPKRAYPLVTHPRGVAAHLVFGATVGAVSEVSWALARRVGGGSDVGGSPR